MSAGLIGLVESRFFTQRALGALDPVRRVRALPRRSRFAITEVGAAWVPAYLAQLDESSATRHGRARSRTCSAPRSPPGCRCCPASTSRPTATSARSSTVTTWRQLADIGDRTGDVGERLPAPRGHEPVDAGRRCGRTSAASTTRPVDRPAGDERGALLRVRPGPAGGRTPSTSARCATTVRRPLHPTSGRRSRIRRCAARSARVRRRADGSPARSRSSPAPPPGSVPRSLACSPSRARPPSSPVATQDRGRRRGRPGRSSRRAVQFVAADLGDGRISDGRGRRTQAAFGPSACW